MTENQIIEALAAKIDSPCCCEVFIKIGETCFAVTETEFDHEFTHEEIEYVAEVTATFDEYVDGAALWSVIVDCSERDPECDAPGYMDAMTVAKS